MPAAAPTWDETSPIEAPSWGDTSPVSPAWNETKAVEDDGLPEGLSDRERNRLSQASEMAALQKEGDTLSAKTSDLESQYRNIESFTPAGILNLPAKAMAAFGNEPNMEMPFTAEKPIVQFPNPKGTNVISGLGQLASDVASGLTTPEMVVTAAGAGPSKLVRAYFGAEIGRHIPEQVEQAAQVAGDIASTPAEKTVAVGQPIVSTAFAALLAKDHHLPVTAETLKQIARDTAVTKIEPPLEPALPISPETARLPQSADAERVSSPVDISTTAPESQRIALGTTMESIPRELDLVTKQIKDFPKPSKNATPEEKKAYLDGKGKLANRANFLREALKIQEETGRPPREVITPSEDTQVGVNDAGEQLYERKDGSRYRMRNDRKDRPNGYPDFGGDLVPTELKQKTKGATDEKSQTVSDAETKPVREASGSEGEVAQPELVGMGGAVPGEFSRGQGSPTAMKYRKIDEERQQRGLEPLAKPESVSDQAVLDRAAAAIDADPSLPERLTRELNENPRAIEDWENHVLMLRKVDLRHEYEKSAREAAQAFDDGRLDAMNEANARTAEWSNKLAELETASRVSGSARGRALRSLRVMVNEDMSLAALEMRARADKGGAPITVEERASLQKVAEEFKAKSDALEKHLSEAQEKLAQAEAERAIKETDAQPLYEPRVLKMAEDFASYMDKRGAAAMARLKERLGRTSAGVDPTILVDVAEIGAAKITRGVVDFAKWSDAMIKDVGEWMKPHLREAWEASQQLFSKEIDARSKAFGKDADKVRKAITKMDAAEKVEDAKTRIQSKIEQGLTDEIFFDVQRLVRGLVEQGVKEWRPLVDSVHAFLKQVIPEIDYRDTMDAVSGHGRFKPLSKDAVSTTVRDLKGQINEIRKIQEVIAKEPVQRTGIEHKVPSDAQRRLTQIYNEVKKKFGIVITDPATQLRSALQARKTYYTNRLADLRHEIDTKQRTVRAKTPSPTDAALDALKAEYATVKAEHDQIFGRRELTDAQRLKMALAAAEKNESYWQGRLENAKRGKFSKEESGKAKVSSAELEAIRARTEAVKDEVQALRDIAEPKKTPEQRALQALKTRLTTRIAEMQSRMARGDFGPKARREVVRDSEANRLQSEKEQVQIEYERARQKKIWEEKSVFRKTKSTIGNVYDAARMLLTTGEFSFILRQGKFNTLAHPIRTARAIPGAIRAMRSEARARAIDLEILNHPEMKNARADKLAVVDEHAPLSKQEELIMGRWSHAIPVVSAFNRAAHVFLNKIRFDTWLAMRKSIARGGSVTKAEGRAIADYVNESTGRGHLGKVGEPAATMLSRIMFSPRYFASRIQYALGHSMWEGTNRSRKVIATEYARTLIGLGVYYQLLNFYFGDKDPTIEKDPRSSDFGKVKLGNTRLDPLAGLAQVATFGSRSVTGETKDARGRIIPLREKDGNKVPFGKDDWRDVSSRFAFSKLHPVPATVANLFTGADLVGNVVTPSGEAMKLAAPLTYVDVYQALKEQDLDDGTALALLAFLGEGLQTHKKRKQ